MTKSTFITNCEFIEVDGDILELHTLDPHEIIPCATQRGDDICRVQEVQTTRYKSRRFKRYEKQRLKNIHTGLEEYKDVLVHDVYIGMDKQTQDLIGLVFEDFDKLESTVSSLRLFLDESEVVSELRKQELDDIKSYGFFRRLKCLFKGIK